jgi:hypothetical protein
MTKFMKELGCIALIALMSGKPFPAQAAEQTDADVVARSCLPSSVVQRFTESELNPQYKIGFRAVNPFYLTGDFDGDGRMDYILRLVSKKDKHKEEDAVFFAEGAPRILSKDIKEDYPGPAWYVVPKEEKISLGATDEPEAKPPTPKGDSIMMVRPESSSALVFWNGSQFELFWQGD